MRGFLVLFTILASLVAWLFWAAPDAAASRWVTAVTRVQWGDSPCVQVYGASQSNPWLIGAPIYQCGGGQAEWVEQRQSGQVVGIDPEMGANSWISCTLWINGAVEWSDSALAGDGNQVSCLRYVN